MPKYRLTDPSSGRTVTVSGDKPPTQQDADAIFSYVNGNSSQPEKGPIDNVLDFVNGATDLFVPATKKVLTQGYGDMSQKASEREAQRPSKGNVVNSAINAAEATKDLAMTALPGSLELASYTVPIGKGWQMLKNGGISGLLNALSKENPTPESVAKGTAAGAVTNAVVGKAGQAVGKVAQKVGKTVENEADQLVLRGLKPSPSQLKNFKDKAGMEMADFLRKYNITDDFSTKAQQHIDEFQNAFDDIAINSGKKVSTKDLYTAFSKRINDMDSSIFPSQKAKSGEVEEVFKNLINKYFPNLKEEIASGGMIGDPSLDVSILTQERKNADKLLKEGQFTLPPEQQNYIKGVRDALKEAIESSTKDLKYKNMPLKDLGRELNRFYTFKDIADKQSGLGKGSNIIGLLSSLMAGAGGTVAGIPGAVGGIALAKASQNPKVIGGASRAMRSTGEAIQKGGGVEIPDFLMKMIRAATSSQASGQ